MIKKQVIAFCTLLLLLSSALAVGAKTDSTTLDKSSTSARNDPVAMLNASVVKTQNLLIKKSKILSKDPAALIQVIDQHIMPILATNVIAQLLVGQKRWKNASKAAQNEFIARMTHLLANTYAKNVGQAGDYKIVINPFLNDSWQHEQIIVVTGKIVNIAKDTSADLNVYLLKNKQGEWKVYDLSIAGISILENLKAQFKRYASLAAINQAIKDKNVKLANQK